MYFFDNFGIIFIAMADALNLALAFVVYRSNPKSATNRLFGVLGAIIAIWLVVLRAAQMPSFLEYNLILTRLSIFLAAPLCLVFFLFARTMPSDKLGTGRKEFWWLTAGTALVMAVNMSPYAFTGLELVGGFPKPIVGLGLIPFAILSNVFSAGAIYMLFRKYRRSEGDVKDQFRLIMIGLLLMLGSIIFTIFLPVFFLGNASAVSLAPLYTLIFLGMTAYAIVKHHLFDIKVIATEALTVLLWIVLFAKVIVAPSVNEKLIDGLILAVVLIFGVFLIRSVRREVKQREQLEVLSKNLEELSKFKSQLLSLASHQIKSPLAIIKGYLTILLDGLYGPVDGKIRTTLEKIKQAADGLTALVEDLLNLRKAEEGKMDYKFATVDMAAMVEGIVESFRVLAYQKGLLLDYKREGTGPIFIEADAEKVGEVFKNLIDNSLKYTPQGFVRVEMLVAGDKAHLSVKDSGLGMAPELLPRLFEEFVRDERVQKKIQGSGFGLYIAKKIVDAHGGKIWAESEGEGKGSAFIVEIPISKK